VAEAFGNSGNPNGVDGRTCSQNTERILCLKNWGPFVTLSMGLYHYTKLQIL
jgi:hypothetical protein